ncbi:MAG: glycosyl hydrolase family 28-related protein [Limisphaerales bacterium]
MLKSALILFLGASLCSAGSFRGADMPWTTYEAEDMVTTGLKLGPKYDPNLVETESSGQKCVKLSAVGQCVAFPAKSAANAIVVRYSLPDSPGGGGIDSTLSLYMNDKLVQKLPLTSRYSWLYGKYPFTNDPKAGKPRNFYDEVRLKDLSVREGDVVRLQRDDQDGASYCIVDLVDLENIAAPLIAPVNSLSLSEFGADGLGKTDDTDALGKCISTAREQNKSVWLPAGIFKITGDIDVPADTTIQGAGMWHTTLVGDENLYTNANRRVRFKGKGSNIHISDFAIIGKLNYRSDSEDNDGFADSFGTNSTIARVWVEHTKVGMWINNSSNLVVEGCRFRDTIADGVNFCVGMRNSTIRNCTTRNTGDDCFALWPATHAPQKYAPGFNVISHCTGQLPFLANGAAIYGGESNRIEDCRFTDISPGCAILLSTTFPTADAKKNIDNNFSGTTVVQNCDLIRSGGYDHEWAWRAAFQICLDRRSVSGVDIQNLNITNSLSDAFSVIARGTNHQETLSHASLANVNIPDYGLGLKEQHGLWIGKDVQGSMTITKSEIVELKNSSPSFNIKRE